MVGKANSSGTTSRKDLDDASPDRTSPDGWILNVVTKFPSQVAYKLGDQRTGHAITIMI